MTLSKGNHPVAVIMEHVYSLRTPKGPQQRLLRQALPAGPTLYPPSCKCRQHVSVTLCQPDQKFLLVCCRTARCTKKPCPREGSNSNEDGQPLLALKDASMLGIGKKMVSSMLVSYTASCTAGPSASVSMTIMQHGLESCN